MARLNAANNAESVLLEAVAVEDLVITVEDASIFPTAPFKLTIENEILEVTEVVGNTFTVLRGQEGTVASAYNVGAKVENLFTAGSHNELVSEEEFMSHKAEIGAITDLQTTDKSTIVNAINEVFQSGNNVKQDMVDALLSVDPSLPISYESTWAEIESATGQISSGGKSATGTTTTVGSDLIVTGIDFVPRTVVVSRADRKYYGDRHFPDYANRLTIALFSTNTGSVSYGMEWYNDGFKISGMIPGWVYDWKIYE